MAANTSNSPVRLICKLMSLSFGLCALSTNALCADKGSNSAVKRGRQIALHVCTACHVVEAAQEYPVLLNPPAPPFSDIANRTDLTRASLRHFIVTTHWDEKTLPLTMPNPQLLDFQIADVVAYIFSLRTH
jgi:mono/diheme cytochrome c family protein